MWADAVEEFVPLPDAPVSKHGGVNDPHVPGAVFNDVYEICSSPTIDSIVPATNRKIEPYHNIRFSPLFFIYL